MHIATTNAGKFYKKQPDSELTTEVSLPSGVALAAPLHKPSFTSYKFRTIISGQFEPIVTWTEFNALREAGIARTATAPTAVIGSSTGITASNVIYVYTMAEYSSGGLLVHESDISNESTAIASVNNQSINISGLPTSHANARVTHKRLYRSDNGGLFRHVVNIVIGTSTYTDTTATLALGEPAPEEHGVPPYSKYNETWQDRVWFAHDPDFPYRVWYSEIGSPESVGSLNYIDTLEGEAITAIKKLGNELLVFCGQCTYSIQGFGESSFRIRKIDPKIGCISHWSVVNINETLFFASERGPYNYDGAFRFLGEDIEDFWREDYKLNKIAYQESEGLDDRTYGGYQLLIPKARAFYYYGHYESVFRGLQPDWEFDTLRRKDTCLGIFSPRNASRSDPMVGSEDGYIRRMNVESNDDDDEDLGNKALFIATGANFFSKPSSTDIEGKKFTKLRTYVESENNSWNLYALGGDEDVVNAALPTGSNAGFLDNISASASSGFTKKTFHNNDHIEGVVGNALQIRIQADNAKDMKYRGFSGQFGPGDSTRPAT